MRRTHYQVVGWGLVQEGNVILAHWDKHALPIFEVDGVYQEPYALYIKVATQVPWRFAPFNPLHHYRKWKRHRKLARIRPQGTSPLKEITKQMANRKDPPC